MSATTVEELEIVIKANIEDALKGMQTVMAQVQKMLSAKMPDIQKQVAGAENATKQVAQQIASSISQSTQQVRQMASVAGKAGQDAFKSFDKARLNVEDTRIALGELNKQMEAIASQKEMELSDYYKKPGELDEAVNHALDADAAYQKLGQRYDALSVKLQQYQNRMNDAKQTIAGLATEVQQPFQKAADAVKQIPVEDINAKMQQFQATANSAMDNLNAKIGLARDRVQGLLEQYNSVASQNGIKSEPAREIESKILSAQAALQKMYASAERMNEPLKKVSSNTDRATQATKQYGKQAKKAASDSGNSFLRLGNIIKVALVASVLNAIRKAMQKVKDFIKEGIQSAINAPEIENMFRVALKGMAEQASQFADQMKKSLGIDQYNTKQMIGTFQNITTSMGIGTETAYKMSKSLTILANDMASLYNVSSEQAFENLQSAMTGQSEAVRKYGYVVNETAIKQTALRYGIIATGQEMTEQQKVVARYLTLLEQSKNAQGDMARTINSLQNQLRILQGNVTAAGRSIGSAFLPFLEAVVPWLNAFMIVLQRVGVALATFTYGLFGKNYAAEQKKQQQISTGFGGIADSAKDAGNAAEKAGKQAKNALAGFDELNVIQQQSGGSGSGSGAGAGGGGLDFDVPELTIPDIASPFEKMADAMVKKAGEIKDALMDLGLQDVLNNFKGFFQDIYNQIQQYDFGAAIKGALLNGFELAMSAINLGQKIVFPIAVALDIPSIVYEAIRTIEQLFETLNDIVQAITPGLEAFVKIGLVPIATWVGGKIKDAFQFLQQMLQKIGDWFTKNTDTFTAFGEALGELVDALWSVVEPLLDEAWEIFKGAISTALDVILELAKVLIKTLTPVIKGIASFIKANKSLIIGTLKAILTAILAFKAAKGIVSLVDKLKSAFTSFGKKAVLSFGNAKRGLTDFAKSIASFIASNPWAVAIGAVLALATAIGVTLYGQHKKLVEEMEKKNLAKTFEGVPLSVEAVARSMQGIVDKYENIDQKNKEHQQTMKDLKTEYSTTVDTIDKSFTALETGSGDLATSIENLSTGLSGLSSNLKSQVDTDGQYFYGQWKEVFANTSVLTEEQEQNILNTILQKTEEKKMKVDQLEGEISNLLAQYREAQKNGETEKFAVIQQKLKEHYSELEKISQQEQERQALVEKHRQALLAEEILQGRLKVTKDNYEELISKIEENEQAAKDAVMNQQAELRTNLESDHIQTMRELEERKKKQQELGQSTKEVEAEITQEVDNYNNSLTGLNANYAKSLQEIGTEAASSKYLLKEGFADAGKEASETRKKLEELHDQMHKVNMEVSYDPTNTREDKLARINAEIDKLVQKNPDFFIKDFFGQWEFVAGEAADDFEEMNQAIDKSLKSTVETVSTEGGKISSSLIDSLKMGVDLNLGEIGDIINLPTQQIIGEFNADFDEITQSLTGKASGPIDAIVGAIGVLGAAANSVVSSASTELKNAGEQIGSDVQTVGGSLDSGLAKGILDNIKVVFSAVDKMLGTSFNSNEGVIGRAKENTETHSPSKVFAKIGSCLLEGLAKGIEDSAKLALDAISKVSESIKTAMQKAFSMSGSANVFSQYGKDFMQALGSGVTSNTAAAVNAVSNAAQSVISKFKQDFQISGTSGLFQTFGKNLMDGLASGIKNNLSSVTAALSQTKTEINQKVTEITDGIKSSFDLSQVSKNFSGSISEIKTNLDKGVDQMIQSLNRLNNKIGDTVRKLKELKTANSSVPSTTGVSGKTVTVARSMNIPQLAQGGVLRKPSLVNVAEYAGAASNPEIVSPQNIMYDTVVEANAPLVVALFQAVDKVVRAIEENRPIAQIGDSDIFASVKRASDRYKKQTGTPAF